MSALKPRFPFFALAFCALLAAFVPFACTSPDDKDDGGDGGGGPVVDDEDLNGIFLKIDGKSYALGNADVYRYSPSNQRQLTTSYTGTVTFHGTKLNYASITVSNTLASDSVQTCGTANTNAAIKLEFGSTADGWGDAYTSTTCQIKLDYLSQTGGIQGTVISATLKNAGNKTIEISNAKFRVFHYTGYEGAAPEVTSTSSFLATLQIDSGSFELAGGQHFRLGKDFVTTTNDGNRANSLSFSAQSVPSTAGAWACNQTFSGGKTNLSVSLGTYQSEMTYSGIPANGSNSGAACSLKVVGQYNGARLVTYSGTLAAVDAILTPAQERIKVRGMYRNYNLGAQLPKANEASAGADSQEVLLTIDSSSWHFPKDAKFRGAKNGDPFKSFGTNSATFGFKHGGTNKDFVLDFTFVPNVPGTYACGSIIPGSSNNGYRTTMKVTSADTSGLAGIYFGAFTNSETPGANCSITVTTANTTTLAGTFTARLIAPGAGTLLPDGDTTLSVSGSFRTKGLP